MAKVKKKVMKKNLFVAAAMMVAMTACVKEADVNVDVEENVPQTEEKVWVEFSTDAVTKAALQEGVGEHQIVWEEDDEISINGYTFQVKEIKEGGLKATIGAFVPADFSGPYRAVYPASAGTSFNELIVNGTPAVVAGGFDDIVSVAYSDDTSLQFKHVTSLFKFQVPAEFAVNTVTISADEALAGKVSVEMADEEATPVVTVKNAVKEVTLTGTFTPGQNYYVAVLPGTKTNLTVSFDGVVSKKWANPVEIEYGMIANMGTLPYARVSRNLEFSETTASATYGEDFTEPTLEGVKDGVEYTSSNTAVATVNATTGEVTLKAGGTTIITASAPESNQYMAGSASYTLTVTENAVIRINNMNGWGDMTITVKQGSNTLVNEKPMTKNGSIFEYALSSDFIGKEVTYYIKHSWYQTSTKTVTLKADTKSTAVDLNTTYLEPGYWEVDGAVYTVEFKGTGVSAKIIDAVKVKDNFYEVEIPSGNYTKAIFRRCNPNGKGVWNNSSEVTLKHMCFCVNDWDSANLNDGRWF